MKGIPIYIDYLIANHSIRKQFFSAEKVTREDISSGKVAAALAHMVKKCFLRIDLCLTPWFMLFSMHKEQFKNKVCSQRSNFVSRRGAGFREYSQYSRVPATQPGRKRASSMCRLFLNCS
jgi:hypothetical protein